jgi:hypothetical protein
MLSKRRKSEIEDAMADKRGFYAPYPSRRSRRAYWGHVEYEQNMRLLGLGVTIRMMRPDEFLPPFYRSWEHLCDFVESAGGDGAWMRSAARAKDREELIKRTYDDLCAQRDAMEAEGPPAPYLSWDHVGAFFEKPSLQ